MSYINLNILHFLSAKFSLTLIVDLSDSTWLNVPHLHARKKKKKKSPENDETTVTVIDSRESSLRAIMLRLGPMMNYGGNC